MVDRIDRPSRPRSGPRRDEAARLAVLHASDDLLAELGFTSLSVEAIARRAGVAKQTIYRWWPSKSAILLDTLIEDSEKKIAVPTKAQTASELRRYLRALARFVAHDDAGKVLLALIAEADHDADTAESLRGRFFTPRRARERTLCRGLASAGLIDPCPDVDTALDAIIGTLVYRSATGRPISAGLVDRLFETVFRPTHEPTSN